VTWHLGIEVFKYLLAFVPLGLIPVMIFLERKGAAVIQDRVGPNRAAIRLPVLGRIRGFGFVHNFSDVFKLIFKEDFIPEKAHRPYYLLAPMIPVATALLTPAVIPWFATLEHVPGGDVAGAIVPSHAGLLLLFAIGSLSVYGVVLGSWGSNSKYSLLGGLRSSAMMISYEVSMGLSILGLILVIGSFDLAEIVAWQEAHVWGVIVQPVAFFLFLAAMFAETGRAPFDVAEGESEIVGGFHTEYSSIKFALFFMGEYAHVVVASLVMATLFFGGYSLLPIDLDAVSGGSLPALDTGWVRDHLALVFSLILAVKALIFMAIAHLIQKQKRLYAGKDASDAAEKAKEYSLFRNLFVLFALLALGGVAFATWLGRWADVPASASLEMWKDVGTAAVQIGVVLAKTLFFCWLFVWVRWTLPRLRYDQIMGLGWKVMLNVALINLLITAIIAKLWEEF